MNGVITTSSGLVGKILVGGCLLFGLAGCAVNQSTSSRQQGLSYYDQGAYGDAAAAFRHAVRQDPRDYRSRYHLARTYEAMGSNQLAIQSYKSALDAIGLSHEGREDEAFRMIILDGLAGAVVRSTNRHAEIDLIEEHARSQQSAEGFFLAAKVHRMSGDVDSALDSYNRAKLIDRNHFYINKEYGLYLEQLEQESRAEPLLVSAYQQKPEDQEVIAALRRLGVTPGPSLRDPSDLARPHIPPGPLPDLALERMRDDPAPAGRRHQEPHDRDHAPRDIPSESVEAPRD